jgi:hypothetical protein
MKETKEEEERIILHKKDIQALAAGTFFCSMSFNLCTLYYGRAVIKLKTFM